MNRPSLELPIDGPSAGRVIGGGAAALIGAALSIAGPPFCVMSAFPSPGSAVGTTGTADRLQRSVVSWMLVSNTLAVAGLVLVLVGVLVLALTPGRRQTAMEVETARATRAYGVAGTAMATALVVAAVGWLSNAARWIAADDVMQRLASGNAFAVQFEASSGTRQAVALQVVTAIAYLAATVLFLSIARDLRRGVQAAIPRALRWAIAAVVIVVADGVAGILSALQDDASPSWTLVRVVVLAPWPIMVWAAARGWRRGMRAEDPETP